MKAPRYFLSTSRHAGLAKNATASHTADVILISSLIARICRHEEPITSLTRLFAGGPSYHRFLPHVALLPHYSLQFLFLFTSTFHKIFLLFTSRHFFSGEKNFFAHVSTELDSLPRVRCFSRIENSSSHYNMLSVIFVVTTCTWVVPRRSD